MTQARHTVVHVAAPDRLEGDQCDDVVWPRDAERRILSLKLRKEDKAHINAVRLMYARNSGSEACMVTLRGLTEEPISFAVHANEHGARSERDGVVYLAPVRVLIPRLPAERYIGLEGAIASRRSTAVHDAKANQQLPRDDFDVFAEGDPLLAFLLEQQQFFQGIQPQDILLAPKEASTLDNRVCYLVNRRLSERVSAFFETHITPLLHYAMPDACASVQVEPADAQLTLVLNMDYLVVGPSAPQQQVRAWRLVRK